MAALEWQVRGSVGPLEVVAALWCGAALGLWRHRRAHGPVLSRKRIRELAVRAGSGVGTAVALATVGAQLGGWLPAEVLAAPLLGLVALLVSVTSTMTAGDAGTLLTDGYDE